MITDKKPIIASIVVVAFVVGTASMLLYFLLRRPNVSVISVNWDTGTAFINVDGKIEPITVGGGVSTGSLGYSVQFNGNTAITGVPNTIGLYKGSQQLSTLAAKTA